MAPHFRFTRAPLYKVEIDNRICLRLEDELLWVAEGYRAFDVIDRYILILKSLPISHALTK